MVLAGQIIAGGNLLNAFVNNEILAYALFTLIFTVLGVTQLDLME
jgi:hypothetical protein